MIHWYVLLVDLSAVPRLFDHNVNRLLHLCLFLQFLEYVDHYFGGSKTISGGRREEVLMANFCAFQFWQRVFKVIKYFRHIS